MDDLSSFQVVVFVHASFNVNNFFICFHAYYFFFVCLLVVDVGLKFPRNEHFSAKHGASNNLLRLEELIWMDVSGRVESEKKSESEDDPKIESRNIATREH